jgi:hypothetical protein
MAQARISDAEWLQTRQAYEQAGGNVSAAARVLGIPRETMKARISSARARGLLSDPYPIVPGKSILYDAESGDPKLVWSTGKGMQGISPEDLANTIEDCLSGYKPPKLPANKTKGHADLAALIPLVDLHMGLKIWGKECGEDWDITIAERELLEAYRVALSRTPKVKKAFVLGKGDLLHADNYLYQTGTPGTSHVLDCDSRYPKMLWSGIDIVISVVNLALDIAEEVEIRILPGNHDVQSSIAIAIAVAKYFHNHKSVTVDLDPGPHWCSTWGNVMWAASHGDKLKPNQMAEAFAAMYPKEWGEADFRYFFSGHEHRERVMQRRGATVETLAAPVPPDSYAYAHGFLSSRHVQCMVYDKHKGRVLTGQEPVV